MLPAADHAAGSTWEADPGTSAVVHGMLSTMAEVLDRLDERLSTLEATIVGQTTATRTTTQRLAAELPETMADAVAEALAKMVPTTLLTSLDARLGDIEAAVRRPDTSALEARLEALMGAVMASQVTPGALAAEVRASLDGALDSARADAGERVERLAEALAGATRPAPAPEWPDIGALLDERLAAVTAGIADLLARAGTAGVTEQVEASRAVARSVARLEADLAEARAESAMAVQSVAERVAADLAESRAESVAAVHSVGETVQSVAERVEASLAGARTSDDAVLRRTVEAVEALVANAGRIEAAVTEGRRDGKGRGAKAEVETMARLADRVAQLQEAVNRSRGETIAAIEQATPSIAPEALDEVAERLGRIESAVAEVAHVAAAARDHDGARTPGRTTAVPEALDEVAARLSRVEAAVASAREQDEARATALVSELQSALGSGMERLLAAAAGKDELVASDVRSALARLGEVASGVDSVGGALATVAEQVARLVADDRSRTVVSAVEAASREQQEALGTVHTALVRRIDGRTSALAGMLEGVAEVSPVLQRLAAAADEDESRAKATERLMAELRDDLAQEVGALAKRQAGALRLLERVTTSLDEEQRRLEGVQALCQSVAGAVEQQAAVGGRVAELVLETRSAMRDDVERLESTLHLDGMKRQQHDQARLAQVASGVAEVVERETALVAQRVAALASTVESLRNSLHSTVGFDGLHAAATANGAT